jgi:hypothetical protein
MIDPTNEHRAEWGLHALNEFLRVCPTDRDCAITDLICDLLHLARREGQDPDGVLGGAVLHFEAEERGE